MMEKDFDGWNKEKKRVDTNEKLENFFYHEREVWWCSVGLNIGVEADGKSSSFERPVLIVHKFNKHMFWGVPLTSTERQNEFHLPVRHDKGTSYAALSQMRTWSSKRLLRKIGMVQEIDFLLVLERVKYFLDTNRPRLLAGSRRPKP